MMFGCLELPMLPVPPTLMQGARSVRWRVQVPRRQNRGATAPMFVGLMDDRWEGG